MLLVADSVSKLNFSQLMQVYAQSNEVNAAERGSSVLDVEQDFYDYLCRPFFSQPNSFCAVWHEGGEYICALRLEPFKDGYLLSGLETRPEYRRKGYAGKLIEEALKMDMFSTRTPVYSHIHKSNTPSQRVHCACGFVKILDRAVYIDGSANGFCDTWMLQRG